MPTCRIHHTPLVLSLVEVPICLKCQREDHVNTMLRLAPVLKAERLRAIAGPDPQLVQPEG